MRNGLTIFLALVAFFFPVGFGLHLERQSKCGGHELRVKA